MPAFSSRLLLAVWLLFTAVSATLTTLNTLTSSGRSRSYWVHPPDEYDTSKDYPAVIAFHGSSQIGYDVDGFALEADIRLSLPVIPTKYSKDRFFVYPNGVDGVWAGPSYSKVSVAEDLQFVSDLLVDLQKQYKVDSARIYATGLSNGGGFVGTLACASVGGQFAALAPVAGSFYTYVNGTNDGCKPARSPLPILEIHGGSDKSVYYNGGQGEGGLLPSIPAWLGFWQQRNGCGSNTTYNSDNGNVHHAVWTCKGINGTLQHWKVDANGHDWPSKTMNIDMAVAGVGPQPIEANDIVIDFFNQFSLED